MRPTARFRFAAFVVGVAFIGLFAAEPTAAQRARGRAPAAAPHGNNVQRGIAAWRAGNYEEAVELWRPTAELGDADAQFNLGQAYRLGRGVAQDNEQAIAWFERAARQRHEQAGTNLGLLLFQSGRARDAMPWLQDAANRGDPRAQYVFGTALYNGDVLRRDLPRAYALMSQAANQGFPQAADQLQAMERAMSAAELDAGRALAAQMSGRSGPPTRTAAAEPPAPMPERTPRRGAGVSYDAPPPDGPPPPRYQPRPEPRREARPAPRPVREAETRPTPPRRAPAERAPERPAPVRAASGNWQVQLGAFADAANARRQWETLRRRVGALGGLSPAFVRAGAVTRLRAGPLASRDAASRICSAARSAGADCIPIPR